MAVAPPPTATFIGPRGRERGNMKLLAFYVCSSCKCCSVIFSVPLDNSAGEISKTTTSYHSAIFYGSLLNYNRDTGSNVEPIICSICFLNSIFIHDHHIFPNPCVLVNYTVPSNILVSIYIRNLKL